MAEEGGLLSSTNVSDIAFTVFRPEPTSLQSGLLIPLLLSLFIIFMTMVINIINMAEEGGFEPPIRLYIV
jgi:hypothetical protein